MTEVLAILGTGLVIISVIIAGQRSLRAEMRDRFNAMDTRLAAVDTRLTAIEHQHGELRERMAHLEGLLDGLREAITGTRGAA